MKYFPSYYYSHNNLGDAAIVLSDFSKGGWQTSQTKVNLPIDYILIAGKIF